MVAQAQAVTRVLVHPATSPQYFNKAYQSPLKKTWFDAWYRGMKGQAFLRKHIVNIMRLNDEFFRENPDYVEGALCGRKNLQNKD